MLLIVVEVKGVAGCGIIKHVCVYEMEEVMEEGLWYSKYLSTSGGGT